MNTRPTETQGHGQFQRQGLSDLAYDLITVLQHKSESVRAYETYVMHAQKENARECVELLKRFQRDDLKNIEELKQQAAAALAKMPSSSASASSSPSSFTGTAGTGASTGAAESHLEGHPSDLQNCSGRSADIGRTAASSSL